MSLSEKRLPTPMQHHGQYFITPYMYFLYSESAVQWLKHNLVFEISTFPLLYIHIRVFLFYDVVFIAIIVTVYMRMISPM